MSGSELDDRILRALREARIHVWRQQHHGKHEQDRIDAVEWLERYEEISRSSQEKTPTYQETGRGGGRRSRWLAQHIIHCKSRFIFWL